LIFGKKRWLRMGKLNLPPAKGAPPKESKMEMFKNMEVVLMLCFGLIVAAALVVQPSQREEPVTMQVTGSAPMPVVIITGKRLSATEKAQPARDAG
jgi:Ni,Fe-hydrogenase III small subunit